MIWVQAPDTGCVDNSQAGQEQTAHHYLCAEGQCLHAWVSDAAAIDGNPVRHVGLVDWLPPPTGIHKSGIALCIGIGRRKESYERRSGDFDVDGGDAGATQKSIHQRALSTLDLADHHEGG